MPPGESRRLEFYILLNYLHGDLSRHDVKGRVLRCGEEQEQLKKENK
jgi:hypothetical protein